MAETRWPDDALEVGRIADAWGVKGWFRVQSYAADGGALLHTRHWHLRPPEETLHPRVGPPFPHALAITAARRHGEGIVAAAVGFDDRSAAESLRGARVFVGRAAFPSPAADEFYWADLIGLVVVNREGLPLGVVAGLIDNGPQSVLRVQAEGDAQERLIPFVAAYVDAVDLAGRQITVDWGPDF